MVTFTCPRRREDGWDRDDSPMRLSGSNKDSWEPWPGEPGRLACSYCGSMQPGEVFAAIERGGRLTPTDKNYKLYVEVEGGREEKFYFQHLDEDGQRRFLALMNDDLRWKLRHPREDGENDEAYLARLRTVDDPMPLNLADPGYFYRLPFFVGRGE